MKSQNQRSNWQPNTFLPLYECSCAVPAVFTCCSILIALECYSLLAAIAIGCIVLSVGSFPQLGAGSENLQLFYILQIHLQIVSSYYVPKRKMMQLIGKIFLTRMQRGVILLLGCSTNQCWLLVQSILHLSIEILNTVTMIQTLLQNLYNFPLDFYNVTNSTPC